VTAQQGSYATSPRDFQAVFAPDASGEWPELAAAQTLVIKLRTPILGATGNKIRLAVKAPKIGTLTLSKSYIGPASTSGNAWNFSAATQITWDGGVAARTFEEGTIFSDDIDFNLDAKAAVLLAFELPIAARQPFARNLGSDVITYFKDAVSEAASIGKGAGYSAVPGYAFSIARLEAAIA
jgi:hypothetical protein